MDSAEKEVVLKALSDVGVDAESLGSFDDEALRRLSAAKFNTRKLLLSARPESLAQVLAPALALVDCILEARGAAAGVGTSNAAVGGVINSTLEALLHRVVDNQRSISDNQRVMLDHQRGILDIVLKLAFRPPSTGKESHGSNAQFREKTIKFYGMGKLPTCMVLGKALPGEFLVAGHLYAVRWTRYARVVMGSSFDVNSPKNGIIWCSTLQHEYEHQRICFSYGGIGSEFILHVLDKSLLPVKLSSVGPHKSNAAFEEALGDVTFGDLHNKHVKFAGADGTGPFRRALALHAKFALDLCTKSYPDDFNPQQYHFDDLLEDEGKQDFVRMWLGQLDTGSVAEGAEGNEEEEEVAPSVDPESVDGEVDV